MNAAEGWCRSAGYLTGRLTVATYRPDLPAYYRRRGYVEIGKKPFPDQRAVSPYDLIEFEKQL